MIKNKTLKRCTVAILIAVLLTFTANKAVSVSAFAITGTVVAASLLATGAIYLGYLTLTGAEIKLPRENVSSYVKSIGDKIAQYGTGAGIYATVYNYLMNNGIEAFDTLSIDLNEDTLLDIYNNSKNIGQIQELVGYTEQVINDYTVTTNYDYPFDIIPAGNTVYTQNGTTTLAQVLNDYSIPTWGQKLSAIVYGSRSNVYTNWYIVPYNTSYTQFRNVKGTNNLYSIQGSSDGVNWYAFSNFYYGFNTTDNHRLIIRQQQVNGVYENQIYLDVGQVSPVTVSNLSYPILTNADIYDSNTHEIIETVQDENGVYYPVKPQWPNNHDNDNNKYPLVPYIELPTSDPNNYVPSTWGVNVGALLDRLDDLADDMVTAGVIGELINAFKNSLSGTDEYNNYEYYTDNGVNYYYYYNNTFQDNDTYNNNTDIQDNEYTMPVDLNTLSTVANNEYINSLKNTAADISETVGDYVAFWHNVDYQTVYILIGGALFTLLCGLIGKMGK